MGSYPKWLIPDKAYDVLKWCGLIVLPAAATAVGTIGAAWGMPHVPEVVTTINAAATAIGAIIGASALKGASHEEQAD